MDGEHRYAHPLRDLAERNGAGDDGVAQAVRVGEVHVVEDGPTVDARHHEVEKDDVVAVVLQTLDGLGAVGRGVDGEVEVLDEVDQERANRLVVIHHQRAQFLHPLLSECHRCQDEGSGKDRADDRDRDQHREDDRADSEQHGQLHDENDCEDREQQELERQKDDLQRDFRRNRQHHERGKNRRADHQNAEERHHGEHRSTSDWRYAISIRGLQELEAALLAANVAPAPFRLRPAVAAVEVAAASAAAAGVVSTTAAATVAAATTAAVATAASATTTAGKAATAAAGTPGATGAIVGGVDA